MAAKSKKVAVSSKNSGTPEIVDDILDSVRSVNEGAQLLGSDGLSIKIRGVISTQCATVDAAIGRGGIPLGRLTLLHGKEGSGKTTLALHIVAETQRRGGVAVYQDMEYKLDPDYAAAVGVDTKRLIISQPSYLEQVFEASGKVIERSLELRKRGHNVPILLVLDSMNAALSKAEVQGDWDQIHVSPQARVYSRLTPKLIPLVHQADVALLWISQIRKKIDVMWGDNTELAGGYAPKFYSSVILDVRRMEVRKEEERKVANKVVVECKKNQISPPFRKGEFYIRYGEGIDRGAALLKQAVDFGLAQKDGSHYTYNGQKLGNGLSNATKTLVANNSLFETLGDEVRAHGKWQN